MTSRLPSLHELLEYVTLGHHDEFIEELLLPSTLTVILLPISRSQTVITSVRILPEISGAAFLVVINVLLYHIFGKTFSAKFHRRRTIFVSFVGYVVISSIVPVVTLLLAQQMLDDGVHRWRDFTSWLVFFTGVFATLLIVEVNRSEIMAPYQDRDEFCEHSNAFLRSVESARMRFRGGRGSNPEKPLRQLNREILESGDRLITLLEGCEISDERRLEEELRTWIEEFRSGPPVKKRELLTAEEEIDDRILFISGVLIDVC